MRTLSASAASSRASASSSPSASGPYSGNAARRRRSTIRPWRTTTVSPGSTRLMPAKIVSRPVVNCICSSSSRARRSSFGATMPASINASGSEAKAKPCARLGVIERLDAERVARQHQAARAGIVQRDRIHAAQMLGEVEPVAAIEMQRQLAIRLGRKRNRAGAAAQRLAQLDVIVDLGIGDQRRAAGLVERLVAGREIDDREPGLHHADIARAVVAVAVGAAMAQCRFHRPQRRRRRRRAVERHQPGDAAHQLQTPLDLAALAHSRGTEVSAGGRTLLDDVDGFGKHSIDLKLVQIGRRQHSNHSAARRAPGGIGGAGEQHDDRTGRRRGEVNDTGVVADRQHRPLGQRSDRLDVGAADEVDRFRADFADSGPERSLAARPDHDRGVAGTAQCFGQHSISSRRPPLGGVARRGAGHHQHKLPPDEIERQLAIERRQHRKRGRMDPGHQQLFGLLVDRVLTVAVEIGVGMRAAPGDARPFRHRTRAKQLCVDRGPLGGLQIVNSIKAALAQTATQGQPAHYIERPGPAVDHHRVEKTEPLRKSGEGRRGQQCNAIVAMAPANSSRRSERLNEIAKRAQPDYQDSTPGRLMRSRLEAWPAPRQGIEVDLARQPLERGKQGGMGVDSRRADAGGQPLDGFPGSRNRGAAEAVFKAAIDRRCVIQDQHARSAASNDDGP